MSQCGPRTCLPTKQRRHSCVHSLIDAGHGVCVCCGCQAGLFYSTVQNWLRETPQRATREPAARGRHAYFAYPSLSGRVCVLNDQKYLCTDRPCRLHKLLQSQLAQLVTHQRLPGFAQGELPSNDGVIGCHCCRHRWFDPQGGALLPSGRLMWHVLVPCRVLGLVLGAGWGQGYDRGER